jgi:hypothetical protein
MSILRRKSFFFAVLFAVFLAAGIALRLWFLTLTYKEVVYDQMEYVVMADALNAGHWSLNCCARTYGYPLFLAGIVRIMQGHAYDIVRYVQVALDIGTGILLACIARQLSGGKRSFPLITFALYMINPFTSGFVGFILTEPLAFFCIALTTLTAIMLSKHRTKHAVLWFLWGILVGYTVYTRIAFFWWGVSLLAIVPFLAFGWKRYTASILLCVLLGAAMTAAYPTIGNKVIYNKLTPLLPYDIITVSMYTSTLFARWPGILGLIDLEVPQEVHEHNNRLFGSMADPELYKQTQEDYRNLLKETIQKDPGKYIRDRFRNMGLTWTKSYLFYYIDPWYPSDRLPVMIGNWVLVACGVAGAGLALAKERMKREWQIFLFIGGLMAFFLTVPLSLVAPEERISLPAYLFVFLFAGYALSSLPHFRKTGAPTP